MKQITIDTLPSMQKTSGCIGNSGDVLDVYAFDAPYRVILFVPKNMTLKLGATYDAIVGNDDAARHPERYRVPRVMHTKIKVFSESKSTQSPTPFSSILDECWRDDSPHRIRFNEQKWRAALPEAPESVSVLLDWINNAQRKHEVPDAIRAVLALGERGEKLATEALYRLHLADDEIVKIADAARERFGTATTANINRIERAFKSQLYTNPHERNPQRRLYLLRSDLDKKPRIQIRPYTWR